MREKECPYCGGSMRVGFFIARCSCGVEQLAPEFLRFAEASEELGRTVRRHVIDEVGPATRAQYEHLLQRPLRRSNQSGGEH